ncbi:MAG TPA: ROK family protein [Terriglobia bacterium]|nr:ROK family protein [Terriglobia bacterium]
MTHTGLNAQSATGEKGFAGVDIGGTRIKVGLAHNSGQLLSSKVLEARNWQDASSFLDAIANEVRSQASSAAIRLTAAGIGCPGRIDFEAGKIVWLKSKLDFLEGVPLASGLGERLECPAVCDNDVNTILAGEMRFGAGRGYRDVIGITVGTGIGGALVIGGRMVRGRNWATGHFGYMSLDPDGPRHVCGNTGIAEERASHSGILRKLRAAHEAGETSPLTEAIASGGEPGLRELFEAADAGDALGRRLADRLISDLGLLVANLVYAIDPEVVLVGGGIVTHRPEVLDAIRREGLLRIEYLPADGVKILPMALGDAAGVLGGAALAMEAITENDRAIAH